MPWPWKEIIISLDDTDDALFVSKHITMPTKRFRAVVDKAHVAAIIKDGYYQGVLEEGKHQLVSRDEKNVEKVDLIFISTTAKVSVKCGTANKFELTASDGTAVNVGVRGTFEVMVDNPLKAYQSLFDGATELPTDALSERLRNRMCSELQPVLAHCVKEKNLELSELESRREEISELIRPIVSELFVKDYGLTIPSFVIDEFLLDK